MEDYEEGSDYLIHLSEEVKEIIGKLLFEGERPSKRQKEFLRETFLIFSVMVNLFHRAMEAEKERSYSSASSRSLEAFTRAIRYWRRYDIDLQELEKIENTLRLILNGKEIPRNKLSNSWKTLDNFITSIEE